MNINSIYKNLSNFTEDSDPISDMGIGYINVPFEKRELKKISHHILKEVMNRINNTKHTNENPTRLLIDNKPFEECGVFKKLEFFDNIKHTLYYKHLIRLRDNVRIQNFKWGDIVKTEYEGKIVFGYVQFSKRGYPITDNFARLIIRLPEYELKVPLKEIKPITKKEKENFNKKYQYLLITMKQDRIWEDIKKQKDKNENKYKALMEEWDKLELEFTEFMKNRNK